MTQSPEEEDHSSSKPRDRDLYTIPISSSWFRWDEIHETERISLPEFFNGSSVSRNPRIYNEYRDFIISKYREDPSRRLTFTEIRKSLIGDVGSLHKVFFFLERWGLINFGASDVAAPQEGGGDGPLVVVENGAPGGVQVVPPLAPSVPPLAATVESGFRLPPLTSYSDMFGDQTPHRGFVCGICGDQCVSGRYESLKVGFVICPKCFETENYKESKSADDLKFNDHIDGGGNHVTSAWTDAETLLLLEAVLKHGDDWDLVAQHVRTKSKLDCIARLIQLPFGEHMLSTINGKYGGRSSSFQTTNAEPIQHTLTELPREPIKSDDQHRMHTDVKEQDTEEPDLVRPLKRRFFPSFAEATDSLMKQVALLSTVAGPHIAATAAETAITAMCNENPCARKVFGIDEDEVTNNFRTSAANNEPESDLKVEDRDTERHKQAEIPEPAPEKNFGQLTFRMRAAMATALGAAAARAKLLADQEEREIEHLMSSIIEVQLRKMQYKIKHFEELESIMEKEYSQIQELKESILEDWISVLQQSFHDGIPKWSDHGFPKSHLYHSM